MALSFSAGLASCAEPQEEQNASLTQSNAVAAPIKIDNALVTRLSRSDPTICTDNAVHGLVILQTLAEADQSAAEKYQLLLSSGGSLEFVGSRFVGAKPETREVTCSATLPKGYSDKPFRFTYALRPDVSGSEVLVGHEGRVDRWFQFRGAVVSRLAEMGLFEGQPAPVSVPTVEPEPMVPHPEDSEQVPPNDNMAEPEPISLPPVPEWNGVGR